MWDFSICNRQIFAWVRGTNVLHLCIFYGGTPVSIRVNHLQMTCKKIRVLPFTEKNKYKPLLQHPLWYDLCVAGGQNYHFKINNTSKWLSFLLRSRSVGVRINKFICGLLAILSCFTQVSGWWLQLGNDRFVSTYFPIHY